MLVVNISRMSKLQCLRVEIKNSQKTQAQELIKNIEILSSLEVIYAFEKSIYIKSEKIMECEEILCIITFVFFEKILNHTKNIHLVNTVQHTL